MRALMIALALSGLYVVTVAAQDAVTAADFVTHLTGTWKAPEERTPKGTEIDRQVFGAGAMDVRSVTLVVSPSGDADLQVKRSVVGATGKVYAPSVMEVKMHIGDPVTRELGQLKPTVTVTGAEERYLDGDHEKWTRDGTRVSLSLLELTSKDLNLQLDTPDGRGSFGATLTTSSGTGRQSRRRPS